MREFSVRRIAMARNAHICVLCDSEIKPGTVYEVSAGRHDGRFRFDRAHPANSTDCRPAPEEVFPR